MKTEFSLREKMQQLEQIEEYFQQPDMDLERAIAKHQEALRLSKEIIAYLDAAESSIEQLDPLGK